MSIRSTESFVRFKKSFALSVLELEQPAGTYRIAFDDEEISGISFLAYRRVAARIHIPSLETSALARLVVRVDSHELEATINADH